jgi:tetratricopeptide (TPR) repeat protein
VGWIVVLVTVIALAAGVVAADPVERYRLFKATPGELETIDRGDFVKEHLLSGSGSGRWQFWTAALDEWREYPVLGESGGAYESWWAEHRSITLFVRDAHSLYLEALGELGVVGFGLVLALVAAGVGVGLQRSRRATGDLRVTAAALTAVFAGYAAAAGFDWVWELAVVSLVSIAALALVCSQAASVVAPLTEVADEKPRRRGRRGFGIGVAVLVVAWALVVAEAIPLLAQNEIHESETALEREDLDEAFISARAARDIQPWAATPYLQLALISEEAGLLPRARQWIGEAIERDSRDWRLWLVSARLETKLGRVTAAEQSLQRAVALNPRSPLFRGLLAEDTGG